MLKSRMLFPWRWIASAFFVSVAAGSLRGDSLNPIAVGGALDNPPQNGQANSISTTGFIYNNQNGQHRAIVEYDISGLPAGVVASASLTGRVAANNHLDTGLREHRVEVYSGNGVVDLADYSVAAIFAGQFSHPSGGSTNYNLDVTAILQLLLDAGASHLGMRVSPVTTMAPDVLTSSTPRLLNFEIQPAGARTASIVPTFDARVYKEAGPWILSTTDTGIFTQQIPSIDYDRRGVLEYNIADIPAGADVTDAKIVFDVNVITSSTGSYPMPPLYGYAGNGTPEMDDAFNTSQQIGVLGPVEELGTITIDVDHEYIQSLLGSSDFFGVAILGSPNNKQLGFRSLEGSSPPFSGEPATLLLEYVLPASPADFDGDGEVDGGDRDAWQTAYGQTAAADADDDVDSDGADFLAWQRALGGGSAIAGSLSVPEPSVAALATFALTYGALFRRPRKDRLR